MAIHVQFTRTALVGRPNIACVLIGLMLMSSIARPLSGTIGLSAGHARLWRASKNLPHSTVTVHPTSRVATAELATRILCIHSGVLVDLLQRSADSRAGYLPPVGHVGHALLPALAGHAHVAMLPVRSHLRTLVVSSRIGRSLSLLPGMLKCMATAHCTLQARSNKPEPSAGRAGLRCTPWHRVHSARDC